MAMPEATINKDGDFMFRQRDVGAAWQMLRVQPVAVSGGMKDAPDDQLGRGILRSYRSHIPRSLSWRVNVSHVE